MINNHFTSNQAVLLVSLVSFQLASLFTFIYKNGFAAAAVPVALTATGLISCLALALVFYFRNKRGNTALADEPHVSNAFQHFSCQIKSLFYATKVNKSKQEAIAKLSQAQEEQNNLLLKINGVLEQLSEGCERIAEYKMFKKTLPESTAATLSPPRPYNSEISSFIVFKEHVQDYHLIRADMSAGDGIGERPNKTDTLKDIVKKTTSVQQCNRKLREYHTKTLLLSADVIHDYEMAARAVKEHSQTEETESHMKFGGK